MKKCIIFTGGEIKDYSALKINKNEIDFVICADSGYNHAKALNIDVDVAIGDFDSVDSVPNDVQELIRYPKDKDDTDTMLAVKLALEREYKNIDIYGALGNRFDHSFANIQTLDYILENGGFGRIITETEQIFIVRNNTIIIEKIDGYVLSVFSYTNQCIGVSEKGVKYPLDNVIVTQSFPIGISNEITDNFAEISVKEGKLLIILSKN
jgi:thiamine pyrophosphokinase